MLHYHKVVFLYILLTVCHYICESISFNGFSIESRIKAIAIFKPDEAEYHKYAAVLAATEPFRLQCDIEIRRSLNPIAYYFHKLKGTPLSDPSTSLRIDNKGVDLACSKYERKVDEIVRLMGFDTYTFNDLSSKLVTQPLLNHRVLLQAYYYKIAADLESNLCPILPQLPSVSNQPSIRVYPEELSDYNSSDDTHDIPIIDFKGKDTKFHRFCHAIRRVELERMHQRKLLQAELGINELPIRMCDPDICPAMCSQVQSACSEFPRIASKVVSQYGLRLDEFESLNLRTKNDFIFRLRVQHTINTIDKKK